MTQLEKFPSQKAKMKTLENPDKCLKVKEFFGGGFTVLPVSLSEHKHPKSASLSCHSNKTSNTSNWWLHFWHLSEDRDHLLRGFFKPTLWETAAADVNHSLWSPTKGSVSVFSQRWGSKGDGWILQIKRCRGQRGKLKPAKCFILTRTAWFVSTIVSCCRSASENNGSYCWPVSTAGRRFNITVLHNKTESYCHKILWHEGLFQNILGQKKELKCTITEWLSKHMLSLHYIHLHLQ